MSSRDATITIRNRTGCTMEKYPSSYGGEDNPYVKDGQITSGPPSTIGDQQNGTLKVEKSSDLSLVGPEGWVVYQIDDGGEKPLVKLTWNHPDNDAPSTYSVVPLDDRVSGTTTDQSGDHDQTVNLNVNYTPYSPNGWDIVLQLSQGLINASLLGAFGHKTSFVAPTDPGMDTSGDTWLGLQVDKMDTPQVKIVQGGGSSVELWLWFTKGTLYYSSGGQRVSQALSNTQVVVTVDLSLAQVEDDAAFAASDPKVQAQLAGLEEQRMSVWAIYLDLRDPDRATGLRVLDSSGAAVSWPSAAVSTLGAALATWGRTSPPAPLVGIGRYDLSGALPPGALLVPTSFEYHTTWVAGSGGAEGSDASTLDVFMMTNRRASPANSGRYVMPAFGPDDTSTARISMSKRAVDEGFVGADLVPQIQAALVASLASVASAETQLTQSAAGAGLVLGADWLISVQRDNGNLNGGRGSKSVNDNALDDYLYQRTTISCSLTMTPSAAGLLWTGSGVVDQYGSIKRYPLGSLSDAMALDMAVAEYQQTFTLSVLASPANQGGQLVLSVSIVAGAQTTIQDDSGFLAEADEWFEGLFIDVDDPLAGLEDRISDVTSAVTAALQGGSAGPLVVTSTAVVLPGSSQIYYSNADSTGGQITMTVAWPAAGESSAP